jgi:hypothetical protein
LKDTIDEGENWRHSKRKKWKIFCLGWILAKIRREEISFLAQSSSILRELSSALDETPSTTTTSGSVIVSTRSQLRVSDRVSGLIKKSYDDILVLQTAVNPLTINFIL